MALSAARNTIRAGDSAVDILFSIPIAATTVIYPGSIVAMNTSGYAVPASAAIGLVCIGMAQPANGLKIDNSSGSNGAYNVPVRCGMFWFANGDSIAITDRGKVAWLVDDQTVAKAQPTLGQCSAAGIILDVDASLGVLVEMGIGLSGMLPLSLAIADPGTGAAIPVTRSGVVRIVTGGGGETNTLAVPTFIGQQITLYMDTDGGGDRVVTVAQAINTAGNTTITLNDVRDNITLFGTTVAGALRWEVLVNNGCTLG